MIIVRPVEPGDLLAVIDAFPERAPAEHERRLRAQSGGGSVYLVAWRAGAPAGFVGLRLGDDREVEELLETRGAATVRDLWVAVEQRRRGVARALMRELEAQARSAGFGQVVLDTGTGETFAAARALYRSLGYVERAGTFLGGWSNPDRPGEHFVDPLTRWGKPL